MEFHSNLKPRYRWGLHVLLGSVSLIVLALAGVLGIVDPPLLDEAGVRDVACVTFALIHCSLWLRVRYSSNFRRRVLDEGVDEEVIRRESILYAAFFATLLALYGIIRFIVHVI